MDGIGGLGSFYNGRFNRVSLDAGFRVGARLTAAFGLLRNDVDLPDGKFVATVGRVKVNYSFSTRALVQALVQYNNQSEVASANVRFAWFDRSGTALFVVFNERRDSFLAGPSPLGRSLIVKYTRFFDF